MTAALEGGEWSAARPGKDPVPIVQEAGWASGLTWTGEKSRSHRDSIPSRPARSSVAIPTELAGPQYIIIIIIIFIIIKLHSSHRALLVKITLENSPTYSYRKIILSDQRCSPLSVGPLIIQRLAAEVFAHRTRLRRDPNNDTEYIK